MRGGRGYNSRGSYTGRGTGYRPNNYGNRMQSTGRLNTRYGGDNYGGSTRYNSNYGGNGPSGSSAHYDSRNRDKFNNSTSGGRHDSAHKRTYRDTSRDRSDDRKRTRPDDYRRTTSTGRANRTPPPPPPPISSTSTSNYRGGNNTTNSYRGINRGDRDNSDNRHRSPMGPPRRPMRTGGYISRARGTMSSSRGMRPMRGSGVRILHRESTDMKIMRRKLLYAQQKDRARVLKIARLTSSLRRRKIARDSKSPHGSSSSEKQDSSDDGNEENGENKEEQDGKSDTDSKKKSTTKSSKRPKAAKSGDEAEGSQNEDADDDDNGNAKDDLNTSSKSTKKGEEESTAETDGKKDEGDKAEGKSADKEKEDGATAKDSKKEGKKKEKDADEKQEKSKSTKKSSSAKKDEKTSSSKKRERRSDDEGDRKEKPRSSRRDDHNSPRKSGFIKLTCIHCNMKCVTFKEYSLHLYSRTHKTAIRQISLRQKAHLLRLRARQRTTQREIEDKSKEEYESKFCHLCRLHYRQPKAKHQLSEHHKAMKKFLMPYCSTCHLAFKSPMLYETHRCSLEHIKNKARKRDSDSDNSGDEMREIDLNKFLTVDSVGEIEVDEEMDVDNMLNDSENGPEGDEEAKERSPVGAKFVKKIDAFYCEICNHYTSANITLEAYAKKHCLLRQHLKAFIRHKEEEDKVKDKKSKDKAAEAKEEKAVEKHEETAAGDEEEENVAATENGEENDAADDVEEEQGEDKLWEDVDKDLGDLLREVEPNVHDEEDDEDESVLNIDIESEKPKPKELNGKKEEPEAKEEPQKAPAPPPVVSTPAKPKPQRKVVTKAAEAKEKIAAATPKK